jgi:serine/threonine protein kinase
MRRIQLPGGIWGFDQAHQLGPEGGFGAVFAGVGADGNAVAVKRLKVSATDLGHRELAMAGTLMNRELKFVLPVYDAGQDADSDEYFIIMPRADYSLAAYLETVKRCDDATAITILLDIVSGLLEVKDITHRDLKPGNILFHEGTWKLADFGIARFVEEATSPETLKGFLSVQFASPEQLEMKHATSASDVYSLGCVAYMMLEGRPPFNGTKEEIKWKHLNESLPPFRIRHLPQLENLVNMMTRKVPESRPTLSRVLTILRNSEKQSISPVQGGLEALASAGALVAQLENQEQAREATKENEARARRSIANAGIQILVDIAGVLTEHILEVAPQTRRVSTRSSKLLLLELGQASLEIMYIDAKPIDQGAFKHSGWDVVLGTSITVQQGKDFEYIWSASLWYRRIKVEDSYRWTEIPYMSHPFSKRGRQKYQPFAVLDIEDVDLAATPGMMHGIVQAANPKFIDDEMQEDFVDRWAKLFAAAASGKLRAPDRLPME